MTREDVLKSMFDPAGRGLEIGPGYNPLLPKRAGYRVETADYTDADGLRAKYTGNPHVDINAIEDVDHVIRAGGLFSAVGNLEAYDYIVASHVIEHIPDPIRFLRDCEKMLRRGGVLVLAVPDKRHCFDVFQPLTSVGQWLQASVDRRERPPLGAILDDRVWNALRGGAIGWAPSDAGDLSFVLDLAAAKEAFKADRVSADYIDVHVWRFVPSSFRLMVNDLHALGEIGLRESAFRDSVGNEFYICLSRAAGGCPVDRLTLARQMLREQAAIQM